MAPLKQQMREHEKAIIEKCLQDNNGNQSHTALALGISRRTLLNKIKLHSIGAEDKPVSPVAPAPLDDVMLVDDPPPSDDGTDQ